MGSSVQHYSGWRSAFKMTGPARCAAALRDFFFMPVCLGCGDPLGYVEAEADMASRLFCVTCLQGILSLESSCCPLCCLPLNESRLSHVCGQCLAFPPPFTGIRAAYQYGGGLATAMKRFKYHSRPELAHPLVALVCEKWTPITTPDVVIPIPLSTTRLRQRGYNQSALLAGRIGKRLSRPVSYTVLGRHDGLPSQVGRSRRSRFRQAKEFFFVKNAARLKKCRHVLLVDDIVTTTATVRGVSGVLKRACPDVTVEVVAVARTPL